MDKQNIQKHTSNSIQLDDRILWYDGSVSLTPDKINEYLLSGKSINNNVFTTTLNEDIEEFNKLNPAKKIDIKNKLQDLDTEWNIPEEFKSLNVKTFIFKKLMDECETNEFSDEDVKIRIARVNQELELYSKYNITDILKTLIYIVDSFNKNKVVWGTGRGSSCSSYVLYLIGLHDVDSVAYELEITEFFRG